MKVDQNDLAELVELAMRDSNIKHMRPVIEKELLHYDILFCLDQNGILDELVFQGGTSLRLCYGGNRLSEDLDFAGGRDFSASNMLTMKQCLEEYVGSRYGLEVTVKEPTSLQQEPKYDSLKINKWQIAVVTTPERKDLPKQRIKIEVASIPAYTKTARSLRNNYDFLPDGYEDMLIYTETLDEIMADKLVSLPATQKYVRYRDIWDLSWLHQKGAEVDIALVAKKLLDYQIVDFDSMLEAMIQRIPEIVTSRKLTEEMKRFLPTDVYDRTFGKKKFSGFLTQTVVGLLKEVQQRLNGERLKAEFLL